MALKRADEPQITIKKRKLIILMYKSSLSQIITSKFQIGKKNLLCPFVLGNLMVQCDTAFRI